MSHNLYKTYFEQAWEETPAGYALIPKRVERFDPVSELLYAPIEYIQSPLDNVIDSQPSSEWITETFMGFVNGEFGTTMEQNLCPPRPPEWSFKKTTYDIAQDYLEQCEKELVYGGFIDAIIRDSPDMLEKLYAIFTNPLIGNPKNLKFFDKALFIESLTPLIQQQLRLKFVMPSFPFKDQCILRANAPPSHVDLGEIALLIRLHTLALAIYQVHPFGADWILVSDGRAYSDMLRVPIKEVNEYQERLLWYRNHLNLQGTISIIDLKEMTRKLQSKDSGEELFEHTVTSIYNILKKQVESSNSEISNLFRVLVRGMKKNTNLKDIIGGLTWEETWDILNTDSIDAIKPEHKKIWREVDDIVVDVAYKYASHGLAMRYHDIYKRFLPDSIRATIHPKPRQIAVPKLGDVFPWNGVGLLFIKDGKLEIRTCPLYTILRKDITVEPYHLADEKAAFFYKVKDDIW